MKASIKKLLFIAILLILPFRTVPDIPVKLEYRGEIRLSVEEKIRRVLESKGVPEFTIQLIIAQAKHESGNFTNRLTRRHNNVFSMMHPRVRKTTSLGALARAEGRNGYASYASIEDAVLDLLLYFDNFHYPDTYMTTWQYARLLKKKGFYEDKYERYARGIATFMREKRVYI